MFLLAQMCCRVFLLFFKLTFRGSSMTMKFTHTATFSNNLRTVMLPTGVLLLLEEEEEDFAYTLRFVAWELITLFGPLSR